MTSADTLSQIAKEVSICTNCALHESRKKAVPGEGPANAEIMFIGEDLASTRTSRGVRSWAQLESFWINCWNKPA